MGLRQSTVALVALIIHGPLTLAGTIVGTAACMAPEQLRAEPPSPRADLFALGVPFGLGALPEVILAQARGATRVLRRDATIPPALDRADMRALSMNADDRPASPQAFAAEWQDSLAAFA